jgi:hypothetical protein
MTTTTCTELFRDYVQEYAEQVAAGRLLKQVIGIMADGRQLELDLEKVNLGPFQKDKLIRYMLQTEGVERYLYATVIRVEDDNSGKVSERVLLICATADEYIGGDWAVIRAVDGTITLKPLGDWSGHNPAQTPGTWFLTDAVVVEPEERPRYAALWAELGGLAKVGQAGLMW